MSERLPDEVMLAELEPTVDELYQRHLGVAKEWFPHRLIPYDRGRDFTDDEWSEQDSDISISPAVRSSLIVNLLTEDNLPHYFNTIDRQFGSDGPWGAWSKRWTAEEGRHSMAIYGYLMVSRSVDPVALERARMHQVGNGEVPNPGSAVDALAYVALQELATRIAHRNTGKLLGDKAGYDVMMRVAADENLHHLFYRDLATKAIELDPSGAVQAIERQVVDFEMPGTGIINFNTHAKNIALAGIYDFLLHHDQVLEPVVTKHWDIFNLSNLDPEAEQARDRIAKHMAKIARVGQRMADRRHSQNADSPDRLPSDTN